MGGGKAPFFVAAAMNGDTEMKALIDRLKGKRFGVVGVGNVLRGDDGAGPMLIAGLAGQFALPMVDASEVPENYGGWVEKQGLEAVVYVDAVDFGGEPGEFRIIPLDDLMRSASSTHRLSLHYVIEYLENEWGGDAMLVGVQPKRLRLGDGASEEVCAGIRRLADALIEASMSSPA
jgi:hydrogenase 3 maturation protease